MKDQVDVDKNLIITRSEVHVYMKESRQVFSGRAHAFESL